MQSDPIGIMSGVNTYLYSDSNPINFMDEYGLKTNLAAMACEAFQRYIAGLNRERIEWARTDFNITTLQALKQFENGEEQCAKQHDACTENPSTCPPPTPKECEAQFKKCWASKYEAYNAIWKGAYDLWSRRIEAIFVNIPCSPDLSFRK